MSDQYSQPVWGASRCQKRVFVGGQEDEMAFARLAHLYACGHALHERVACEECGRRTACPSSARCARCVRHAPLSRAA